MSLGVGVMLNMLGGNSKTVGAVKASVGKNIKEIEFKRDFRDTLIITLDNDSKLSLWDGGQSCCEHRYMQVDNEELPGYQGATLMSIEVADGPDGEGEYDESHEIQFLKIITNKGTLVVSNHNEHNGYYGGFWIQAKLED